MLYRHIGDKPYRTICITPHVCLCADYRQRSLAGTLLKHEVLNDRLKIEHKRMLAEMSIMNSVLALV